ncbi:MFS transporter [Sphingomonas canadensis]|uniref:MFS transporter n=1 Tax=Sphingomonas canadensis TaxID=1219257 RepID=A0ABW3H396_9SPHN|nr:MFS transporter [Sphingomonas canadensis]MCW3835608.1 MFS transporter [Sphingomonas canadensis]
MAQFTPRDEDVAFQPPPMTWRSWYTVVMLGVILMLSHIDRGVISLLVQPIKKDLGLSDTEMSVIIGIAFSSAYIVAGLPLSRLADHASRKLILVAGLSFWSVATAASAMANSFGALFAARMAIGAGESVQAPASLSLISNVVPRHRLPRAFSIYSTGGFVGMAASMVIGGVLIGHLAEMPDITLPVLGTLHDWQMVFLICGIPGLIVATLFFFTVPEPPRPPKSAATPKKQLPGRDVFDFLKDNRVFYIPMFLGASLWSIEALGMTAWRVAFFERSYGWGPQTAGPLLGIIGIVTMPFGLAAGAAIGEWLDKKRYPDAMLRLYCWSHALMLPLSILAVLVWDPWAAVILWALSNFFTGVGHPGMNSAIQIVTPNHLRGQVSWLYLFFVSIVGSGMGPMIVALTTDYVLQDEAQLRWAMVLVAGTLGPLGLYLSFRSMKPYGEMVKRIWAAEEAARPA